MPRFWRKLLSIRNAFRRSVRIGDRGTESDSGEAREEKWKADFGRPKTSHFDIKSESSYDANLQKFGARHCLFLGLKKKGCIAWVEAPDYSYRDKIIEARIRLDARGGYAAAGIMFRVVDARTYYSFLISNKGYFRLDVSRNGMPQPLAAWTELPDKAAAEIASEHGVDFTIAAYGSRILILIGNQWAAEINDSSITEGSIGFIAASYEDIQEAPDETRTSPLLFSPLPGGDSSYTAETFLESLTVDSRIDEVAAFYEKQSDAPGIEPRSRFRLAETFAAMNQPRTALTQILKAWETAGYKRRQKELLLAGRLALALGLTGDAEKYIASCFEENVDSPEGQEAVTEMARVLCAAERYEELKAYCGEAVKLKPRDSALKTFQGHAFWNLNDYKNAAKTYDEAFELDRTNGIPAKNAANVYEVLGKKKEALERYLEGGRVFLAAENYNDLGLLVPKLLALGGDSPDAHGLAGKWAFGIEDWEMARSEFEKAEALTKKRKRFPKDAALVYLRALLLIREGKRGEALPLLEEAAALEKDYALFSFKLAENRYFLNNDPNEKKLLSDLDRALALAPEDGWINNFAAELSLKRGEPESAVAFTEKASAALGEIPEVRMNRAELLSAGGKLDEALLVLAGDKSDDPDGALANRAGNLLVKAGRFEEADEKYRAAIMASANSEYLFNRASCLIELGLYGEADAILSDLHGASPNPDLLELISYVAVKKGEFLRAETACRSALEMDPDHVPSLLSLGWILAALFKFEEGEKVLRRLDELSSLDALSKDESSRRDELRRSYDNHLYAVINCASCDRKWKVLKDPPPVQGMRLLAMPPDDLPAGSCPECGRTFCIGCAKERLDDSGRFICPDCGKSLKFTHAGLKKIIYDWTLEYGLLKKRKPSPAVVEKTIGRGRGRPRKNPPDFSPPPADNPEASGAKRGRGRPKGSKSKEPGEKSTTAEAKVEVKTVPKKRGRPRKE